MVRGERFQDAEEQILSFLARDCYAAIQIRQPTELSNTNQRPNRGPIRGPIRDPTGHQIIQEQYPSNKQPASNYNIYIYIYYHVYTYVGIYRDVFATKVGIICILGALWEAFKSTCCEGLRWAARKGFEQSRKGVRRTTLRVLVPKQVSWYKVPKTMVCVVFGTLYPPYLGAWTLWVRQQRSQQILTQDHC